MRSKPYPTDLTDAQWELVRSVVPGAKDGRTGTPRRYPLREIWNAIVYQAKNGGTWRALPHDFPPWPAVWQQYRRWRDKGTLDAVHEALRAGVRQKEGRRADPSAAIQDSQSVRVAENGVLLGLRRRKEDHRTQEESVSRVFTRSSTRRRASTSRAVSTPGMVCHQEVDRGSFRWGLGENPHPAQR